MERTFLHPAPISKGQIKTRFLKVTRERILPDGTIVRQLESEGPQLALPYQHAIQVVPVNPKQAPIMAFGEFDAVNQLGGSIDKDPEAVVKAVRPTAPSPSGAFYINKPAPKQVLKNLDQISNKDIRVQKFYDHPSSQPERPLDRTQMETKAMKEHMQGFAPAKAEPMGSLING